MGTVKILHCADLHIGASSASIGERGATRKTEALLTFEKAIDLCQEQGVNIMLISGDLFCSNDIPRSYVSRVIECIEKLGSTEVVFAAGNHDPLNSQSPFNSVKLPSNFHILPTYNSVITFENLGVKVYGRSFPEVYLEGERRFPLTADPDYINIMCQHGELRSDLSSNYNSITPEFIENSGMDYIALGHIHKRSEPAKRGQTYFAYSGCTQGLGFDELGVKGVYIGDIGKGICDLEFYKTSVRTHEVLNFTVDGICNEAELCEKILSGLQTKYGETFADNLYKIVLNGTVSQNDVIDTDQIAERLMQTVYFAKVIDRTQLGEDLEVLSREKSLKGIFVSKMLERINSAEEGEKEKLLSALKLGLKAFVSEVNFNGD